MNAPVRPPKVRRPPSGRPPSGVQVRAQSRWPDDPVLKAFSRRMSFEERKLALEALREFVRRQRIEIRKDDPNRRCGEIWRTALALYDYLAGWACTAEEVFPSVARMAQDLGLGESTVHMLKAQLQAFGMVDWRHRAEPAEEETGPGRPPLKQLTNLYRVNELPEAVQACLKAPRRNRYRMEVARLRRAEHARRQAHRAAAEAKEEAIRAGRAKRPPPPSRDLIVSGRRAAGQPPPRDSS